MPASKHTASTEKHTEWVTFTVPDQTPVANTELYKMPGLQQEVNATGESRLPVLLAAV